MEDDFEHIEWEEAEIESHWIWEAAHTTEAISRKGANNASLTLCRRRDRREGSNVEPQLYVCKALYGSRHDGIKFVKRELDMLRRCEHPNILRYEDFSYGGRTLDGTTARLFTEHCAHRDLDQFRSTENGGDQRLSFHEGVQVFHQLAQALLYIHHGVFLSGKTCRLAASTHTALPGGNRLQQEEEWDTILHRDIKPSNVFVAERNQYIIKVKLGDFGLARLDTDDSLTYVGTRTWLAPEQRHSNNNPDGKRRTTLKSDIYSLGLTMSAVSPQLYIQQLEPPDITSVKDIMRDIIFDCQQEQDTRRPTSLVIVDKLNRYLCPQILRPQSLQPQRLDLVISDTFKSHLRFPGASVPADFWNHETLCQLCRRLVNAGGADYVRKFDAARESRFRTVWLPVSRPSWMAMPEFTPNQTDMVYNLRAGGESMETAVLCTRAVATLGCTIARGKRLATLVLAGWDFDTLVARLRQQQLGAKKSPKTSLRMTMAIDDER